MKCPPDCKCDRHQKGKHAKRARSAAQFIAGQHNDPPKRPTTPYNNTTIMPEREHLSTTYGDQQRERCQRAMKERHARGIEWRATPSGDFDWDRAIAGFRAIMAQYGYDDEV